MTAARRPQVVVVGAGFAGLDCARALVGEPVDVTVVDRNNFHTFQPLLYQVATAGLAAPDVAHPVRGIFRGAVNVRFRRATVTGVDWDRRLVLLDGDGHGPLPFDHLVLAAGATTSWYGVPGAAEHGLALYSLEDAVRLRNHVLEQFEAADADPTLVDAGALTVVVVGGGPTGVEMAGALVELVDNVLRRDLPGLDLDRARIVLVEMAGELLSPFSEPARRHAADQLIDRGVELRLGQRVASVSADGVTLASGEHIACRTLVWAAGVRANPLADRLGLPQTAGGRIVVGPDLRVPGLPQGRAGAGPDVFVVGDLAAIDAGGGRLLPQLAPVAKQSGRFAGRQIARLAAGRPVTRFRYTDRGTMATIGRRAAVADLPLGIRLTGTPAWLAWLFLHLLLLAGFRNRLSVFVNWLWGYLTYDRGPRLILPAVDPDRRRHDETATGTGRS